jgi:predicted RNA binding protein YcfA (HicA-like mRNA interferase family)
MFGEPATDIFEEEGWGEVVSPDLARLEEIFADIDGIEVETNLYDQEIRSEPLDLNILVQDVYRESDSGEIVLLLSRQRTPDQSFTDSGISKKCQSLLARREIEESQQGLEIPKDMWDSLPTAFVFAGENDDYDLAVLEQTIRDTSHCRPRDGLYKALYGVRNGGAKYLVVSGEPHNDIRASYPEVRACIQKYMSRALAERRMDSSVPPRSTIHTVTIFEQNFSYDPNFESTFDERDRETLKEEIQEKGFEAMAWYAPYHFYDEETWGIYFDSAKLDQFAWVIFEGLRADKYKSKINPMELAGHMAFGSVYAHEMFHAKVEAILSWLEITSSAARFLKYKKNVYDKMFLTEGCLEEALANWSSFQWVETYASQNSLENVDKLLNCFKQNLDLSPPGYRNWRRGSDADYWRVFSTQIATGLTECSNLNAPLPTAGLFKEPFPFHFLTVDIPVRFVDHGVIANSIQGQESNLPHISRKEFVKALKYFGYKPMRKSRGKGSHELWADTDNRKFTVPSGKSISHTVSNAFFTHCSITKTDYVRLRLEF